MFGSEWALRLRRLKRRFGVLSPSVVVRAGFSRKWGLVFFIFLFILNAWIVWFFCYTGQGGGKQLVLLRERLHAQEAELEFLRTAVGTGKNEAGIEKALQRQLQGRLGELEAENFELKQDMLIFERLIPLAGRAPVVRVENFKVQAEAPTRYRYRVLLAYQASQRSDEFRGTYQVIARFTLVGELQQKIFPEPAGAVLEIRHFLRREGVIEIPPGAKLAEVELRLLQDGRLVAKQDARL